MNRSKTKLLIIGSNGQLGKSILKLDLTNFDVMSLDRQALDITNSEKVEECVSSFAPKVIVNAAAYTAVDKAENDHECANEINCQGVKNIAISAEKVNAVLIHISTDYVFNGQKLKPYVESDDTDPQTVYGKTKLSGELMTAKYCRKHLIIRTSWVFSEYGSNFVRTMLKLADRNQLSIVNDQIGGPTYAGDIASTILQIVNRLADGEFRHWGTFHYSGEPYVSWYEFAAQIFDSAKVAGICEFGPQLKPISSFEYPTPAKRPKNSSLSNKKIYKHFGIAPSDWQSALKNLSKYG